MFHSRIEIDAAASVEQNPGPAATARDRAMAILIVLTLPFLAAWWLVQLFWRDMKAIGRGLAVCVATYAEELASRR